MTYTQIVIWQDVFTRKYNESKISRIRHNISSYDEPNAEQNYADLLTKVPWAKRVHGIHGSDAAHKACAEPTTDRFVTVDGDNTLRQEFINSKF